MRDDGEPISRGQLDRKGAETRALGNVLFVVALFTGVVLVNGILAILFIEFFQAIGWWEVSASEGANSVTNELSGWMRVRTPLAAQPLNS